MISSFLASLVSALSRSTSSESLAVVDGVNGVDDVDDVDDVTLMAAVVVFAALMLGCDRKPKAQINQTINMVDANKKYQANEILSYFEMFDGFYWHTIKRKMCTYFAYFYFLSKIEPKPKGMRNKCAFVLTRTGGCRFFGIFFFLSSSPG